MKKNWSRIWRRGRSEAYQWKWFPDQLALKKDALSSQANLAGYVTVIQAAFHCQKYSDDDDARGYNRPGRVFIIGAGVAGLQAIATAKRLGARVEAFDTDPLFLNKFNLWELNF